MSTTSKDFASAVESFVGCRWRPEGRSREKGVDCGGLLIAALRSIGIECDDMRGYDPRMPNPDELWRLCRSACNEVGWQDSGEGRIGLCSWPGSPKARHLVVMLDGNRIAHSHVQAKRVVVQPAGWLDGRLIAVFRVKGIDYGAPWSQ